MIALLQSLKKWFQERRRKTDKATVICAPQPDPLIESLQATIEDLRNEVLSRAKENNQLKNAFHAMINILPIGERVPVVHFYIRQEHVVIAINDLRPPRLVLTAFLPSKGEIAHIYASGNDGHFILYDMHIEPEYRRHYLGTKMLAEALISMESHDAKTVTGTFTKSPADADNLKYFFQRFGFTVTPEGDNNITIAMEFREKFLYR